MTYAAVVCTDANLQRCPVAESATILVQVQGRVCTAGMQLVTGAHATKVISVSPVLWLDRASYSGLLGVLPRCDAEIGHESKVHLQSMRHCFMVAVLAAKWLYKAHVQR